MADTPTPGSVPWQAAPSDAIRLAALRWFLLEIERLSIELFASDKTLYPDMEAVLRNTLKEFGGFKPRARLLSSDDCPDGYYLCKDGLCAPMCDGMIPSDDD